MRVLVVYCHPDATSFASSLHAAAVETLRQRDHDVTDLDLYAEGFRPVMTLEEHIAYSKSPALYVKSVEKYAEQLARAEAIVAVYPTWWYGLPAMLKGYFDRVWAPGIAYDMKQGHVDTSRLAHIRRLGVVTTYGAPWWLIRFYMGDPEHKLWSRGVRQLCAKGCRLDWLARYNMDSSSPDQLRPFIDRVKRTLARW